MQNSCSFKITLKYQGVKMIEYMTEDNLVRNLAQLARQSVPEGDHLAIVQAVDLLDEYYYTDNAAFRAEIKPLSFRDFPVHKAIGILEATENRTTKQNTQLTVLKEGLQVEAELLLNTQQLVIVAPDIHHWDFTADRTPNDMDAPFKFGGPGTRPLIYAWPELRYSGLNANPADPKLEGFDAGFVLNPQREVDRSADISAIKGYSIKRVISTDFVNATQNLGRRIAFGTPEGQFDPDHWVDYAQTTKRALELV